MLAHRVPAIEMAFMMPVMKNEWDIYKTNRSRRSSECSNPQACRSRKVSAFCALQNEQCLKREQKARAPIARCCCCCCCVASVARFFRAKFRTSDR